METAFIVLYQAVVMFLMIVVGYICFRAKLISEKTNLQISNLLLMVINPCIVFTSFQIDFSDHLVTGLLTAIGISILAILVMTVLSRFLLKKDPENEYLVERFGNIYTNCGFFGTPLAYAMFGDEGVLYITACIAVTNFFMWTQGVGIFTGKMKPKQLLNCLKAPVIIAIFLGLIFFFCHIKLPDFIYDPLHSIGSTNSPIAMIAAGAFIAQTNLGKAFTKLKIYWASIIKLFITPIICGLIFILLPIDRTVASTVLVAVATPCAVACMMFPAKFGGDPLHAADFFSICTLMSVISIPSVYFLYNWMGEMITPLLPYLA